MKRVILALFAILAAAGVCMAQTGVFEQRGMATQGMRTAGMTAAHPSLPVGSTARVINTATNEEIEVTIVGRISPSLDRIIDLTPAAAQSLGLADGVQVLVTTARAPLPVAVPPPVQEPPPPPPAPEPPVAVAAAPAPPPAEPEPPAPAPVEPAPPVAPPPPPPQPQPAAVAVAPQASQQPITITIHNFIVVPDEQAQERPSERPMRLREEPQAAPPPVQVAAPPPPPPPVAVPAAPEPRRPASAPINDVEIIPGLPDPHAENVYRLQVGAFSGDGSVSMVVRQVESAGFVVVQERHDNLVRVMVDGIHSRNVQAAVQRLAAMGFTRVWVRE